MAYSPPMKELFKTLRGKKMNQLALSFPAFYPLSRLDSYLNHIAKRYHV